MARYGDKETDRQLQAFEFYFGLGEVRSKQKVADYIGVSYQTIVNWSQRFNWDERCEALERANYAKIQELDKKRLLQEIVQYRKIIKASVTKYLEELKKGGIEIKSVKDLATLIRLDLDLLVYIDNNKDDRTEKDDYVEFFFSDKGK